jgi:hypothetical protein
MLALSRGKHPKTETLKFLRANGFELPDNWPYEELQVTYAAIDLRGNVIDDPDLIQIEPCVRTQGVQWLLDADLGAVDPSTASATIEALTNMKHDAPLHAASGKNTAALSASPIHAISDDQVR